jgi:DNA-binding Lrp family transcriptional regulator
MRELWGSPSLWNEKRTQVQIARKLGIDEETVRNRIKFLRESGFLLGWRLLPNPSLIDRESTFLYLELDGDEESKEHIISKLTKMEGVVNIASFYGQTLLITLYDDSKKSSAEKITKLGIRATPFIIPGMSVPNPLSTKMKSIDWQILRLMLRDAEKEADKVAKDLKISERTVRRRLSEMMTERAIFIMPIINLKRAGGIPYQLIILVEEDKKSEVDRLVASRIENLVFRASASKTGSIFGFTGANVAEGSEILNWVKKLPGVKAARMNIVEEILHVFDWLEGEVKTRANMP